jgi:UDP-2,4-diacetamido-2,4,6-trideoxy-beta-L-altropyranose hydrolase
VRQALFLTVAGPSHGLGHLKRCTALAGQLSAAGVSSTLVLLNAADLTLKQTGTAWQAVFQLQQDGVWSDFGGMPLADALTRTLGELALGDFDAVVVDAYAWTVEHTLGLRERVPGALFIAIDDLINRDLAVDCLINHNFAPDLQQRYQALAGTGTIKPRVLSGPAFALIDPSYATEIVRADASDDAGVHSVGIFLGGGDVAGPLKMVLEHLELLAFAGAVEVVASDLASNRAALDVPRQPYTLVWNRGEASLRNFFARHALHIGAGGGATWERFATGAPTLAIATADNQLASLPLLHEQGLLVWAQAGADDQTFATAFQALCSSAAHRRSLSELGRAMVDGRGAARAAAALCAMRDPSQISLRRAVQADEALLLQWANDPQVRASGFSAQQITPQEHSRWFASRLALPSPLGVWVAEVELGRVSTMQVGNIRFEANPDAAYPERSVVLSYALDKSFRGLGLGRRLLGLGLAQVANLTVIAFVKPTNTASAALFTSLGFAQREYEIRTDASLDRLVFVRKPLIQ